MNKYKIIALFGKSGAGKDTILRGLEYAKPEYNQITMTTTRPIRQYEKDGIDYHFISSIDFAEKILNGDFIEAVSFNNWFYGTDIHELKEDTINVGVFSIKAIECMLEDNRLEVYPVYIRTSDKTRLLRSLNREASPNCEEICRRFFTDEQDFADIPFDYKEVFNNETDPLTVTIHSVLNNFN